MTEDELKSAHEHSINHRKEIEASEICGCFCCVRVFDTTQIWEWLKDSQDNEFCMCPHCGIDAVIGDKSGYQINNDLLNHMNKYWFDGNISMVDNSSDVPNQFNPKYKCKFCHGSGQVPGVRKTLGMGKGMGSQYGPCPECDGIGWIDPEETLVVR